MQCVGSLTGHSNAWLQIGISARLWLAPNGRVHAEKHQLGRELIEQQNCLYHCFSLSTEVSQVSTVLRVGSPDKLETIVECHLQTPQEPLIAPPADALSLTIADTRRAG